MTSHNDGLQISLLGTAAASGLARTLVRQRLDKWGFLRIADDVLVVTSELVTNAAQARPREEIVLLCRREHRTVLVAVWDGSHLPPTPRPASTLIADLADMVSLPERAEPVGFPGVTDATGDGWSNGGRGLHLVQALAAEWGYCTEPADPVAYRPAGKWVWARLPS